MVSYEQDCSSGHSFNHIWEIFELTDNSPCPNNSTKKQEEGHTLEGFLASAIENNPRLWDPRIDV